MCTNIIFEVYLIYHIYTCIGPSPLLVLRTHPRGVRILVPPSPDPGFQNRFFINIVLINKVKFPKQIIFFGHVILSNEGIIFSKQIINFIRNVHISERKSYICKQIINFLGQKSYFQRNNKFLTNYIIYMYIYI